MKITKCDRCEKIYEHHIGYVGIFDKYYLNLSGVHENKTWPSEMMGDFNQLDFCKECQIFLIKEMAQFFTNLEHK